ADRVRKCDAGSVATSLREPMRRAVYAHALDGLGGNPTVCEPLQELGRAIRVLHRRRQAVRLAGMARPVVAATEAASPSAVMAVPRGPATLLNGHGQARIGLLTTLMRAVRARRLVRAHGIAGEADAFH